MIATAICLISFVFLVLVALLTFFRGRKPRWKYVEVWLDDGQYQSFDQVIDFNKVGSVLTIKVAGGQDDIVVQHVRDMKVKDSRNQPAQDQAPVGFDTSRPDFYYKTTVVDEFVYCVGRCQDVTNHRAVYSPIDNRINRTCTKCKTRSEWDLHREENLRRLGQDIKDALLSVDLPQTWRPGFDERRAANVKPQNLAQKHRHETHDASGRYLTPEEQERKRQQEEQDARRKKRKGGR